MNLPEPLKQAGWAVYPDLPPNYTAYWGKSFYPEHKCAHNEKVSICIYPSIYTLHSYTFKLYGGLQDDSWVCLENYSILIPEEKLMEKVDEVTTRLIRAWEALHA